MIMDIIGFILGIIMFTYIALACLNTYVGWAINKHLTAEERNKK